MHELLKLRFSERDKKFSDTLRALINDLNRRGLLHSGESIKRGHEALIIEFKESRKLIVATFLDTLKTGKQYSIDTSIGNEAIKILHDRKKFLENFYLEKMKVILSGLSNKTMFSPYLNLKNEIALNEKELIVELNQAIENYQNSLGSTLFERVKNQFLNRPLIVICVITISAVTTIMVFLKLIGLL
jgi:hypothetical protein